jgi:hypothetical protein
MMSLLLPSATTGVSLIAGWCVIVATPRGQSRTSAMMLPHGCEGLHVLRMTVLWTFRRPFMGRPVPRQLLRNELLDLTTIVPATAYHRLSCSGVKAAAFMNVSYTLLGSWELEFGS